MNRNKYEYINNANLQKIISDLSNEIDNFAKLNKPPKKLNSLLST